MFVLKHILVASDLSPRANSALARAVLLAEQHRASTSVLHVVNEGPFLEKPLRAILASLKGGRRTLLQGAKAVLREQVAALAPHPQKQLTVHVELGRDFVTIIRRARAESSDLVVLGAHGAHFLRDLFIGSTAEKVVREGDRPVLVVKKAPKGPYRLVLAPVDFSDTSRRTLELATRIAPEAIFYVLHAYEIWYEQILRKADVPNGEISRHKRKFAQSAKEQMKSFLHTCNLQVKIIKPVVKYGRPATVIRNVAHQRRVDLVAIGTHGRTGLHHALLGSVAEHVLREANCDVLTMRPEAFRFELP
jgi:nucleotide-binding universal stress UspA family protein